MDYTTAFSQWLSWRGGRKLFPWRAVGGVVFARAPYALPALDKLLGRENGTPIQLFFKQISVKRRRMWGPSALFNPAHPNISHSYVYILTSGWGLLFFRSLDWSADIHAGHPSGGVLASAEGISQLLQAAMLGCSPTLPESASSWDLLGEMVSMHQAGWGCVGGSLALPHP